MEDDKSLESIHCLGLSATESFFFLPSMASRAATHTMPSSMLSEDGITYPPFPLKIHSSTPQDDDAMA